MDGAAWRQLSFRQYKNSVKKLHHKSLRYTAKCLIDVVIEMLPVEFKLELLGIESEVVEPSKLNKSRAVIAEIELPPHHLIIELGGDGQLDVIDPPQDVKKLNRTKYLTNVIFLFAFITIV